MDGKIIAITGVTRGLGLALAREFVRRGHTVWGCGRNSQRIRELQSELDERALLSPVDISDFSQVERWAESLLATGQTPDFLLNNAAVINRNSELWKLSPAEFDCVIDINIKGTFYTIRAFLPAMIQRGRGVIVNFSSGWGRTTSPQVAPYCATKWAVEGLTRALAQELPPPLAAIPLNPGIIHTEMLESCFGESASLYPTPDQWVESAADFILKLGRKDNGKPLSL